MSLHNTHAPRDNAGIGSFWSKSSKPAPNSNASAEVLLKQGTDYLNAKKYRQAIIVLERIREEYPFSAQAVEVELKLGEAYHLSKKYSEAESAYKDLSISKGGEHETG